MAEEKTWTERETNLKRPLSWNKMLHEVTGTIARRGPNITVEEYGGMLYILGAVMVEMNDDKERLLIQSGGGSSQGRDQPAGGARLDYGPNR